MRVIGPPDWIALDVVPDTVPGAFGADDVVVAIALPHLSAWRATPSVDAALKGWRHEGQAEHRGHHG